MSRTRQIQLRIETDLEPAVDERLAQLAQLGDEMSRNAWINRVIRHQLQQPVTTIETEERI